MLFTYGLMLVTAYLVWATLKLWRAGDDQIEISKQLAAAAEAANEKVKEVERAYLTGGGGWGVTKEGKKVFHLDVGNDGKTPAFLLRYAFRICQREELLKGPDLDNRIVNHSDRLAPGVTKIIALEDYPALKDSVVYGRFWYQDIWRETERSFGFLLSLHGEGGGTPDIVKIGDTPVSEAFTSWT